MFANEQISFLHLYRYEQEISENYIRQILSNTLYAGMVTDRVGDKEKQMLIYVTGHFDGWLELVWTSFSDKDATPAEKADLLRYVFRAERERIGEPLKGIFCETHIQEIKDREALCRMLKLAGMETTVTDNNIYEFSLSEVKDPEFLKKAADRLECVPLSKAEDELLFSMEKLLAEDEHPVPLPARVYYGEYLGDESFICLKGKSPCGLLLLYEKEGYLVIDCAFVTDPQALAVMLGNAYIAIMKKRGPGQKLLVPVVVNKTAELVERMVPTARRGEVIEGVMWL